MRTIDADKLWSYCPYCGAKLDLSAPEAAEDMRGQK